MVNNVLGVKKNTVQINLKQVQKFILQDYNCYRFKVQATFHCSQTLSVDDNNKCYKMYDF